jgi:hypothetical protein
VIFVMPKGSGLGEYGEKRGEERFTAAEEREKGGGLMGCAEE